MVSARSTKLTTCTVHVAPSRKRSDAGAILFFSTQEQFAYFRNSIMVALGYQVLYPLDYTGAPVMGMMPSLARQGMKHDTPEAKEFVNIFWLHDDRSGCWSLQECKRVWHTLETIQTLDNWCSDAHDVNHVLKQFKAGLQFAIEKKRRVWFL